jgi:predicted RecB family nuclease
MRELPAITAFLIYQLLRGRPPYFPVYSNKLKDIGQFIGASWTSSVASGLQSLVWRYSWEESGNIHYKNELITYNKEDCYALQLLTNELSKINNNFL